MPTVVDVPPYDPGFFSCLSTMLGALDAYERGAAGDGLRIDLCRGRYLDPARGGNWWEYASPVCASVARTVRTPGHEP